MASPETLSVADFQRDMERVVPQLKETGASLFLTANGRAELVVQDADSYRQLLERVERAETVAAIRAGFADAAAGRVRPAREVLAELGAKLGFS